MRFAKRTYLYKSEDGRSWDFCDVIDIQDPEQVSGFRERMNKAMLKKGEELGQTMEPVSWRDDPPS